MYMWHFISNQNLSTVSLFDNYHDYVTYCLSGGHVLLSFEEYATMRGIHDHITRNGGLPSGYSIPNLFVSSKKHDQEITASSCCGGGKVK